jgi:hypothetical protein
MEKFKEQTLKALLAQAGLEPKEGDLERFEKLIDTYTVALKALHSADVSDEEIALTFHPERRDK